MTPESNSEAGFWVVSASSSEDEKERAGVPMGSATTALLALGVSRPIVLGVDVRAIIWSYREVRETAEMVDLASSSSPSPRDCFRIHLSKTESLPAGVSFGFSCRLSAGTTLRGVTDRSGSLSKPCWAQKSLTLFGRSGVGGRLLVVDGGGTLSCSSEVVLCDGESMEEPILRFFHKGVVSLLLLLGSFLTTFGEGTIFKSDSVSIVFFCFQEGVTWGEGTIVSSDSCSVSELSGADFLIHEGVEDDGGFDWAGVVDEEAFFSFFFQAGTKASGCCGCSTGESSLADSSVVLSCRFCHAGTDAERGFGASSGARFFHEGGVAERVLLSLVGSGKKDFFLGEGSG